jgi:hypothetical protein
MGIVTLGPSGGAGQLPFFGGYAIGVRRTHALGDAYADCAA